MRAANCLRTQRQGWEQAANEGFEILHKWGWQQHPGAFPQKPLTRDLFGDGWRAGWVPADFGGFDLSKAFEHRMDGANGAGFQVFVPDVAGCANLFKDVQHKGESVKVTVDSQGCLLFV
jgi:hypothetical protein